MQTGENTAYGQSLAFIYQSGGINAAALVRLNPAVATRHLPAAAFDLGYQRSLDFQRKRR